MAQGIFNHPRTQVLRFDPQYPVLIMHVHIPPDNTLQGIQVRTNVVNMLPVSEVGLENKDVHIRQLDEECRLFGAHAGLFLSGFVFAGFVPVIARRTPAAAKTALHGFLKLDPLLRCHILPFLV